MTAPLTIVGLGLASPLGRNLAQHLALFGAETSLGRSARYQPPGRPPQALLACEWLSPQWRGAARIAALAEVAAKEALAGAALQGGCVDVDLIVSDALTDEDKQTIARTLGQRLCLPVRPLTGRCALVDALQHSGGHSDDDHPRLIVAADSWLSPTRLDSRPRPSPWEPAELAPAEAAAAIIATSRHTSLPAHPLAHVLSSASCMGSPRSEGIVDGAALTQLFRELPALQSAVSSLWGRRAGSLDLPMALSFASARAAAFGAPLSGTHTVCSLADEIGALGAAEMLAELVMGLGLHLKALTGPDDATRQAALAPLLTWATQDSGRWAMCVAVPAAHAKPHWPVDAATPPPPAAIPIIHPAIAYADRSAPRALEQAALAELTDDIISRAHDRSHLPLNEQERVEARLHHQAKAASALAPELMLDALDNARDSDGAAPSACAFAGAMLLGRGRPAELGDWLSSCDTPASAWAAAAGLALVGAEPRHALDVDNGDMPPVISLEHHALLALGDQARSRQLATFLGAKADGLNRMTPALAASCFRAAGRLVESPLSATAVLPWLDSADRCACREAGRLLLLMRHPDLIRSLQRAALIERLGSDVMLLAALRGPLVRADAFEQWVHAVPVSEASLRAMGLLGHPRSHGYLAHFLLDDRLADAADEALRTLLGDPPEPPQGPDDWEAFVSSLGLDPTHRYRRGKPWSTAVVLAELRDGSLSRNDLAFRLDELRCNAGDHTDGLAADVCAVTLHAPHARLTAQLAALTAQYAE